MLITALPSFCPPPLKVSMSSVLSKQTQILKVSDHFLAKRSCHKLYFKKLFQRTIFFQGGVRSHSICESPTSSYGSNRESYLLIPDLPRMISQGSSTSTADLVLGGRAQISIPKMRKNLLMYWRMTLISISVWRMTLYIYKTHQFCAFWFHM